MTLPYSLGDVIGIKGEIIEISSYIHNTKDGRVNVTEYHVVMATKEGILNAIVDEDQILTRDSIEIIGEQKEETE